ncbi:hypothetical protein EAH72_16815 [Pseudomonas caspiana]|nr:hypothetical protein EAH72_16815 [Pseudomonas caspiana]
MWERACSRRRRHIQHGGWLTHRYREQARSHKGFAVPKKSGTATDQMWERACSRRPRHIQHGG